MLHIGSECVCAWGQNRCVCVSVCVMGSVYVCEWGEAMVIFPSLAKSVGGILRIYGMRTWKYRKEVGAFN